MHQTFVDNILSGTDTVQQLQQLYNELHIALNHWFRTPQIWLYLEFLEKVSQSGLADVDLNLDQSPCKV